MSERLVFLEDNLAASPREAEPRLLLIIDFVRANLDELIHQAGGIDAVVVEVDRLYVAHVQPLDIPWIVEPLETLVFDLVARKILEAILRRLHDRIHKES